MNTIFMNSENSKTSEPNRLLINLADTITTKRSDEYIALWNLSVKKYKKVDKNDVFKISALTRNEKFELPDGLYSVQYIYNYFEYIAKKQETLTDNRLISICVNKIENKIAFNI